MSHSKPNPQIHATEDFDSRAVRVGASCRTGRANALYLVQNGVAVLVYRSEPRGLRRGRAFAWGRGGAL